jgi:hypothetical protein
MKINNLNIHNSNVTIAEKITNSQNSSAWGIDKTELKQLIETIKQNETPIKDFVNANFDTEDTISLAPEKQSKFIVGLKKFGFEFATKLSSTGIVELLKYFLLPVHD